MPSKVYFCASLKLKPPGSPFLRCNTFVVSVKDWPFTVTTGRGQLADPVHNASLVSKLKAFSCPRTRVWLGLSVMGRFQPAKEKLLGPIATLTVLTATAWLIAGAANKDSAITNAAITK